MADQIKVFKNQIDTAQTGSLSTFSIDGVTTDSSTKAVIKEVELQIKNQNPLYDDMYKFPLKAKLNNFPVFSTDDGRSVTLTGSQIVDSSSTFSFEVQPEEQANYFPEIGIFLSAGSLKFYKSNASLLDTENLTNSLDVMANLSDPVIVSANSITGYGSTAFLLNGVYVLAYTTGSLIQFVDQYGESRGQVTPPWVTYQLTQDDTYIYAASGNAGSNNQFIKIPKNNLNTYSYFSSTTYLSGLSNSNPGFVEHYNGFLYYRAAGSNSSLYKISLATGTATTISFATGESEHLGARIVLNSSGVPHIVEWNDLYGKIWNLSTNQQLGGNFNRPSGTTDPTTTSTNHTIVIAPGCVLVNNKSYNQSWIVNINGSYPTVTNITALNFRASGDNIFASTPLQVASTPVTRDIKCSLLISGIESV